MSAIFSGCRQKSSTSSPASSQQLCPSPALSFGCESYGKIPVSVSLLVTKIPLNNYGFIYFLQSVTGSCESQVLFWTI
jgi:hypothetical protein